MKRNLLLTTALMLLSTVSTWANEQYDFTAKSGDNTLYYKITKDDADAKEVAVVTELYYYDEYKAYTTAPIGTLTIPATIVHDEVTYSVTSIGDNAFCQCNNLTGELIIPSSIVTIGKEAFYGCSFTGSLTIPNSVTSIGSSAFKECNFDGSLTLGENVETIGESAFNYCHFTNSLTIPNSVNIIGNGAFSNLGFTAFVVDDTHSTFSSQDGVLYNKNKSTLIQFPTGSNETEFIIPSSVTSIEDFAFIYSGLSSIDIASSVISIGNSAFSGCVNLSNITIPSSVASIGGVAFASCANLSNITMLANTPPTVGWSLFLSVANSATVTVPFGSKEAYDNQVGTSDGVDNDDLWCGLAIVEAAATGIEQTQAAAFTLVGHSLLFSEPTAVAVYNASGVMLFSGEVSTYELPSAAGMYIVRTANASHKVMVNY